MLLFIRDISRIVLFRTGNRGNGYYQPPRLLNGNKRAMKVHIESSYVSPEEIGRLLVPHGATTIIADPHEIVNVCGLAGLNYMLDGWI